MYRPILVLAGLLIFGSPGNAAATLQDVQRLMTKKPETCAAFTQRKTLRALKRPLISTGQLMVATGGGIFWQVLDPIETRLIINRNTLIQWGDNNVPKTRDLGQLPVFHALTKVFLAVVSGELLALSESFTVKTTVVQDHWNLELVPRDPKLLSVLASLSVSGSGNVESLSIQESRGDQIQVRFRNIAIEKCKLSTEEKRFLAK